MTLAVSRAFRSDPGEQHVGADRRSQRHEQRKSCERVEIFVRCERKISVEQGVGGGRPAVPEEIHDREGKIVEHVDRCDHGIELDRIEQHRLVVDQHDVRQMQVAVAAPHISLPAALLQQSAKPGKRGQRRLLEIIDVLGRKAGRFPERRGVAFDDARNRMDPGLRRCKRGTAVGGRDRFRDGVDKSGIERTGFGQMIDGLALVEAGHFDGEFDRRAACRRSQAIRRRFA